MAIITTLVTGIKILKKVLDKKKQKETAKKFVIVKSNTGTPFF